MFRTRYGRTKTKFIIVPNELDTNSSNTPLVNAALAAGLYPKIILFSGGKWVTLANNQPVLPHPSSVNFQRKVSDFGANYLAYFTLM